MNLSGLGIEYSGGDGQVGKRVPDVQLRREDHSPVRLYELLRQGESLLLIYMDPVQAREQEDAIQRLLLSASGKSIQAHLILRNGVPAQHRFEHATSIVDHLGEFEIRIGPKTPRVLLIRPDGYMGVDLDGIDARRFQDSYRAWAQGHRSSANRSASSYAWRDSANLQANILGAFFTSVALAKLAGSDSMKTAFDSLGLPRGFVRPVGLWQATGALATIHPPSRTAGAALLSASMAGAAATHLRAGQPFKAMVPLALFAATSSLSWRSFRS